MSFTRFLLHKTWRITRLNPHQTSIKHNMSTGCSEHATTNLLAILSTNPKRFERIQYLNRLFHEKGFELRIAGGAVRDILLGQEPQDIDFATTARPEESLSILRLHDDLLRIIVTASGQKHGTVAVKFKEIDTDNKRIKLSQDDEIPKGESTEKFHQKGVSKPEYDQESPFEITTLRCDKITDGRHAEVEFVSDWRVDAERRDLTINAMFLTLDDGKLVDYFNGASDLREGLVRFVGDADKRIKEDYLRIMRFFRFWSRYGRTHQPDSATSLIIQNNLEGLKSISGERIWLEMKKIFAYLPCKEVVSLMQRLGLFDILGFMPEGIDRSDYYGSVLTELEVIEGHIQQFKSSLKESPGVWTDSTYITKVKDLLPVILLSSTIRSLDVCVNLQKRMKFSNLERDLLLYIIENRLEEPTLEKFKKQIFLAPGPERPGLLIKIFAFMIFKGCTKSFRCLETWQVPTFPLSGGLVAKELSKGGVPNKMIKTLFERLKVEWCKSEYTLSAEQLNVKLKDIIDQHKD